MTHRTLHIIDPSTPNDAMEMLALWLASSPQLHHQVLALGPQSVGDRAINAGVGQSYLHRRRAMGWADPAGWRAVGRALGSYDPTTLHAWGIWGMVAGSLVPPFTGTRVLSLCASQFQPRRVISWATRWTDWNITHGTQRERGFWNALGMPDARLTQITPAVATHTLDQSAAEALREKLRLDPGDHPVLLVDANDDSNVRPDHAIWAAAIIQQICPRTRVLLRLSRRQPDLRLRDIAESLGNPEMLCFAGEETPLQHLAAVADIFVFPPDQTHGVTPLLHAMAAGIPIVATATSETLAIMEDNTHALLARPGKPRLLAGRLEHLISHPELIPHLRTNSRELLDTRFTLAALARGMAGAYASGGSTVEAIAHLPAGVV